MLLSTCLILASFYAVATCNYNNLPDTTVDAGNSIVCPCSQQAPTLLLTSCQEIKSKWPDSVSGYYTIGGRKGIRPAYCNMGELCGSGGGWTRLAYLDMSDATEKCPSGFNVYEVGGVRACGRPNRGTPSCVSVTFPSNGISYSQVCGRVVGYQYGSPDAVHSKGYGRDTSKNDSNHDDINSYYVDGVSITCGSPRQHVWTLMAGLYENSNHKGDNIYTCPCFKDSPQKPQSFIGDDYFCESGNPLVGKYRSTLYELDPLWDGKGCGSLEEACCTSRQPWFKKKLVTATTDHLELRVCGDESAANEDVPVSSYEIYVK